MSSDSPSPQISSPDSALGLENWRFQHAFRSVLDESLLGTGLTGAEYGALSICRGPGGTTGARLARDLHITPQAAGRTIARLVRDGLVQTEPAERGPALTTRLTNRGIAVLRVADGRVAAAQSRMLAPLTASERAQFIEMMGRCADSIGGVDT